jgi:hypothetical protein
MTKIINTMYKDQSACQLASEQVRATFLPGTGAKLASLVYLPLNRELLVQRPAPQYALQPFDGDYVAGECSGLDDMFPTIDAYYYDRFPWAGTKMADHGEVWSLPWETVVEQDSVRFSVHGVRFPYQLEKRVSFVDASRLRWDYRLTSLSDFEFDFVWAAHSMFYLEEAAELVLPAGVRSVVGTFDVPGKFGRYGDEFAWPVGTLPDGSARDFRCMRPKAARDCYKYYVKEKVPEGWCAVKFHQSNFTLAMSFPVETVPYLGVLPNEGGWQDLYNIFLEPCSAPFDRPDAARYRGQGSTLAGRAVREWYVIITLAMGTDYSSINSEGQLVR